jgi:hypothetical protein
MKKIAVLDNMVQARTLEAVLKDQKIPHVMKTYHDSAYDGLFQGSMGWGHVEAPEAFEAQILAVLGSLRADLSPDEAE